MSIKKDDLVVVISGNHKGQGPVKVMSTYPSEMKLELQGVGTSLRHVKRGHPKSPQGGRVQLPVTIQVSNVAIYCSICRIGVRISSQVVDGSKRRCCVRCKTSL